MSAHIGVTGLAVMGANLARATWPGTASPICPAYRSVEKTDALLEKHGQDGDFVRTETLQELVDSLEKPRRVLIMVKAGQPVDAVIESSRRCSPPATSSSTPATPTSPDTPPRGRAARTGLHFVGIGVSGGEEGALHGPRIMPGGTKESYDAAGPMLQRSPPRSTARPAAPGWHRRRRPLRQDGPQRHRVRRHPVDRRGLRPDASGAGIEPAEIRRGSSKSGTRATSSPS